MFATLVTVTLFAAAINGAAAQLSIDTPQMTTCSPVQINWSSGTGPYNLIMVPAADPCGDALVDAGDFDGTSTTWTPNLAPGTQIELSLVDSTGDEAWSGAITIAQGSDTSCVPADQLAAASSSSAAATASSSASVSSDSSSVAITGTTLVVTGADTTATSAKIASTSVAPVGAVGNSGPLGGSSNGAMTQVAAPFMILSAVATLLAFSL